MTAPILVRGIAAEKGLMGIFSRLFRGNQDGTPASDNDADATDEVASAEAAAAEAVAAVGRPETAHASPVMASSPILAGAGGVGVNPLAGSIAWPQGTHATSSEPPAPRSEAPVTAPPDDPPRPRTVPPKRAPLPGVPKQTSSSPSPSATPAAPTLPTKPPEPKPPARKPDNDATMTMSPPPPPPAQASATVPAAAPSPRMPAPRAEPPIVTPAPAAVAATPVAPVAPVVPAGPKAALPAAERGPRTKADTIGNAFDQVMASPEATATAPAGTSTPADLAAVRGLFQDVAVAHVSQVRDVMLELRYGEADPAWIESTKPALRSLRAMAGQMELAELCGALDEFCAVVDAAVINRARISDEAKAELLASYQRLVELIPQAFELDAERDRREPIIVEALLYQIEGVEKPTIDKLFAVGLHRLDALMSANTEDVVAVSGMRRELAEAIVQQFRSYRASPHAAMSSRDPAAERRALADLLIVMSLHNDEFNRAAISWTSDAKARKRRARKDREQTFQKIKIALARLGERDQLVSLEKQPFQERIASLDKYLSAQPTTRPQ
jgi:hypothetical protein